MEKPMKPTSLSDFTQEDIDTIYYSLTRLEMMWRDRLFESSEEKDEDECRQHMEQLHALQQKVFWMDQNNGND